ncbi:lipoprotein-anchoring transpeptidase ErfK/SrfK [Actinomadura pelletieri DSM 43383]|uniref:Lipoprotein-anchoring transpeptidase ErfK/SrfK n=1 Tax=Actinomadura pelletieri DSM 43383 TaxID=1120940 RepID=A0A495Q8T8_9ACTN|nr:Ig-like domain-containing protein [Actinomadura pelletieri]RKS67743.1 lipoprotein-anchoring transpeptidase ErfK/SrfK [Actinomadura pelletieri DSM 43383]
MAGVVLLLTTACSGGEKEGGVTVGEKADAALPQVTISPGNGNTKAKPEDGVVVTAAGGTLQQVAVTLKGKPVDGEMAADKTSWKSRTLRPGAKYQVTAVATNPKGKTATVSATFATLKAPKTLGIIDITPSKNEKVGVGMPIRVVFNRGVADKKTVEKALVVKSTKPATGAWHWVNDTTVIFRTKNGEYWQPNQEVTFSAKLAGVLAGKKTYGTADYNRRFRIGDEHILRVSTKTKRAVAMKNGTKVRSWPISAGKGGRVVNGVDTYLTTSGIHLTMGKENPAIMTSEWMGVDPKDKKNGGYREVIPHAVRISDTGEYVHSMAATMWAQGRQNVSHGCLNSPPKDARWFYNWSYRGDPVIVTGTKRRLDPMNGWSYYQMTWNQWVKGSALDRSVTTG